MINIFGKACLTNHEKFKNVASGIQSLVVVVGVAVGAIWTVGALELLKQRETAEAALAKTRLEAEKIALDIQKAKAEGAKKRLLIPSIRCSPITPIRDGRTTHRFAQVELTLHNTGNDELTLDFTKMRFYFSRVDGVNDRESHSTARNAP